MPACNRVPLVTQGLRPAWCGEVGWVLVWRWLGVLWVLLALRVYIAWGACPINWTHCPPPRGQGPISVVSSTFANEFTFSICIIFDPTHFSRDLSLIWVVFEQSVTIA